MFSSKVTTEMEQNQSGSADVTDMKDTEVRDPICLMFIQLPNEVLEEILYHVPTKYLLRSCRFVNETWKQFSTTICHQRRVKLRSKRNDASAEEFMTTFRNPNELPWSACTVNLINSAREDLIERYGRDISTIFDYESFLDKFGPQIRELTLEVDNYLPCDGILKKIPNVEMLTISCEDDYNYNTPVAFKEDFQLSKLKEFGVKSGLMNYGTTLDLIEMIQRISPRLETMNMRLSPYFNRKRIIRAMRNVRSIRLEYSYSETFIKSWNMFLINNIKEFKVIFQYPRANGPRYYLLLEQFLILYSGQLEKLTLNYDNEFHFYPNDFGNEPTLALPPLPQLKLLQFGNCEEGGSSRDRPMDYPFLSLTPFTTGHFPVLKKVMIGSHVSTNRIFNNSQFDSVETLWMENKNYNLMETEWHNVFPNLKELSARVDGPSLEYIFRNFTNLEKLCLCLRIDYNPKQTTVNSILSGVPHPAKHYKETKETILQLRKNAGNLSLLNLTQLKHLELDFYSSGTTLMDPGAYLSLLKIQPLEYLSLEGAKITSVCEQRLAVYHHIFDNKPSLERVYSPEYRN